MSSHDKNEDGTPHFEMGGMYVAPAGISKARAEAVLPQKRSEDASWVLGNIVVPERSFIEDREYLPPEQSEWILTATFAGNPELDPRKVEGCFDREWRERLGQFMGYNR